MGKALNVFYNDKETWCVTDADNPDAIHKAHQAIGISMGDGDVSEVSSIA